MPLATALLRRCIAHLSATLVLVGVLISGHAQATHVDGILSAIAAPCHHAMATADSAPVNSALDLCRELCLNKIPDTAISSTTAPEIRPVSVVSAQLAYALIPPTTSVTPASAYSVHRPVLGRTRPPTPFITTRLLI